MIRVTAFLFGRRVKKWLKNKSPDEKKKFFERLKEKKNYIFGILGLYFSSILLYYITHLENNPLIKRSQFIMFSEEQRKQFSDFVHKYTLQVEEASKSNILPKTHPIYTNILRATASIINANKDLPCFQNKKWTLTVIDSPTTNAFVLPGGNIFVYTGLLRTLENYDQLAVILSHEIAHSVLNHPLENISRDTLINFLLAVPIALIWAIFPDLLAAILHLLGDDFINIFISLPYNRDLESEADFVGLLIASRACIDAREAVVLWGNMRILEKQENIIDSEKISWLSTHPSTGDREKKLNELLPEALKCRDEAGCPRLTSSDPREFFYRLSPQQATARLARNSYYFRRELENQNFFMLDKLEKLKKIGRWF